MTIYFDKECHYWSSDDISNEYFLNTQIDYVRDLVKHRGYVYMNQIYEMLGAKWDTRINNLCIEDPYFTAVIGLDGINNRWVIDIY